MKVVVEPEVREHHWEELPARRDYREEVAVEEADREVYEDLAQSAWEADHEHISGERWVWDYVGKGVISVNEVVEQIERHVCKQLDKVVREHEWVCKVSAWTLMFLISLCLHHAIKQ